MNETTNKQKELLDLLENNEKESLFDFIINNYIYFTKEELKDLLKELIYIVTSDYSFLNYFESSEKIKEEILNEWKSNLIDCCSWGDNE